MDENLSISFVLAVIGVGLLILGVIFLLLDFYNDYKCSTSTDINYYNEHNCIKYYERDDENGKSKSSR